MIRLARLLLAWVLVVASLAAGAQTPPTRSETPITDEADLLSPLVEAELAERLIALRQDWSVDVQVVTLSPEAAAGDVEALGEEIATDWRLDAGAEGRSVLLLVNPAGGDLYLRAGPGLAEFDAAARQAIVNDAILPAFRAGDLAGGVAAGVEAILARLGGGPEESLPVPVTAIGESSGAVEGGERGLLILGGVILAVLAGLAVLTRRGRARSAATPCPACGGTGLVRRRVILREPTETRPGEGATRTTCPRCGHVKEERFVLHALSAAAGPGAGGASGAAGRGEGPGGASGDDRDGPGPTTGRW